MIFQVGDVLTHQFVVDQALYEGFVELFGDKNPLHTDADFAKRYGHSSVVMHGNILGGFLSYFIGEMLPVKNVMIISQNIAYKNPVFCGDVLDFEGVVDSISEAVGVVDFKYKFTNAVNKTVGKGVITIKLL